MDDQPVEEKTQTQAELDEEESTSQQESSAPVYQDGVILLYTCEQLCAVGSGVAVMTGDVAQLGSGEAVTDNQGQAVVYGLDAQYRLARDIEMPAGELWQLPQGFTGGIAPAQMPQDAPLYDGETQAIYIYNPYQLMTMAQSDAADQPVLDGDWNASRFGVGSLIYPEGETGEFLTYDPSHPYIISASFCSDMPEISTVAPLAEGTVDAWGRDFAGQVLKEINGETYILIGNADQLRAIGSDATVYTAVYQAKLRGLTWEVDKGSDGNPIMLYGGDADLLWSQNGNKDYTFGEDGIDSASGSALTHGRCGVNQTTGEIDPDMDIEDSGATYSSTANYIIFRDIDLSGANWTPLTFSGTMIGAVAESGAKLWNEDSTSITATKRPVISNVRVVQDTALDVGERMGVGFFATLYSETGEVSGATGEESFGSTGATEVSNLILSNPTVHTTTTETTYDQTLINGLLSGLGGLLGGLLDGVLGALGIHVGLQEVLTDLLNARKNDPTALATGTFAGRVVGQVNITNCDVVNPSLVNVNASTGGFVGYSEGVTSYATEGIGTIVDLLSGILNGIPGLGLGDLITVLLDNGLAVGSLVPTGYTAPQISDCHISGLNGTIGNDSNPYAGGFVGLQIGTKISDCTVKGGAYTVASSSYGGGFVGLARDAEIKGLLSNLGVELFRLFLPQSLLLNCEIEATSVTVTGGEYQGGFVGALANSYAINDSVTGAVTVTGAEMTEPVTTGSSVGGFVGIATTGWVTNLGAGEDTNNGLLDNVGGLVTDLLSQNPGQAQMLLSLAGIAPSAVMGCQVNGDNTAGYTVTVSGNDYVGGMLGKGDGVYLTPSTSENIAKLSPLNEMLEGQSVAAKNSGLNGLSSVTASGDYAGGIAGSLGAASVGGLLNDTVGVASFLGFTVSNFQLSGPTTGLTVTADRYAGGAFGEAVGGDASSVSVDNLAKVTASNYAAGFVGVCGPGDLAATGGLTLNLLGLDNLLKVDSLLSVIPGVKVELTGCTVTGIGDGFTVQSTGTDTAVVQDYVAGGFAAHCNSAKLSNCHVDKLASVTAADLQGYAGGFVGVSRTGGLAELANEDGNLEVGGSLISVENLLGTIDTMVPNYTNCTVTYIDGGYVQADVAGGFAGDFQSGKVNNNTTVDENGADSPYAVYNIDSVQGQTYAGGFGGKVYSGALADAGGGISILGGIEGLNISVGDLLKVIEAYVPYVEYAGVKSDKGFTVTAEETWSLADPGDIYAGSAGGFIGYASGAQISSCDVTYLKHTTVTPPDDLEAVKAPDYFNEQSTYAVTGGRYAGGFIGCMDIGSAASVGSGLGVLGSTIALADILSALNVVVTTIEHSDVNGAVGGYSVLASNGKLDSGNTTGSGVLGEGALGHAGGFAGAIYGGHIQNSQAHNFEYIIGLISAGGYVGEMEPGDVTRVMEDASILSGLISADTALASLLQTFVPTIRNSSTDAVPCGGVVRAQVASDATIQRGMAGGYVGHNMGGSIWGLNTDPWKTALDPYDGPTSLCTANRIRSVYGAEYAGGYTGFMEAADTANVGGLSILDGLISVNNILGALGVVYPTQENTAVYGPLANLDYVTWNNWVEYVGKYGGYGYELAQTGKVNNLDELNAKLAQYIYGFHVVAGRSQKETLLPNPGGDAGGYVGLMRSGTLTNCMTYDVKLVRGWHAAGGYAGSMETGGAANFGGVSILGLNLSLDQLIDVAELFVPAVKNSSVYGYTSGLTVQATGLPADGAGYAGGYVGCAYGAQIQLNSEDTSDSCDVGNLRRVTGRNAIGGYVGLASAASLASVNTNASDGLLQGILDSVISKADDLVQVLPATYTTIHKASVSPADSQWGFVVDGAYTTDSTTVQYAPYAGGFAGYVQAAVLGEEATPSFLTVTGLRSVDGGLYAGGFLGLADVAAVAEVGGTDEEGSTVDVIGAILNLGSVDALDVLRCYIYNAGVTGVAEGYTVQAHSESSEGILDETRYTGCAGGFAGGLMNGTIQNSSAENLSTVQALNYTGGFVGHMGKSGVVDVDSLEVLNKLLGATVGAIDLFGSQVLDSSVTGITAGAVVKATGGDKPIAGGFSGYSDLGRIKDSTVINLKKVTSDQIAGGFNGKTDMAYLVETQVQSVLLEAVLQIVNKLLEYLYLGDNSKLEDISLVDLNLGVLKVEVLNDGNTLKVELLGLPITVALSKAADSGQQTDVAIITIGDSVIRLPCTKENGVSKDDLENAEINLIKGNRTELDGCKVTGIDNGYDVFGGGATQEDDGTHANGMAGGFVGYNHEGKISNSEMVLCDVVRGTEKLVGPFTGYNDLKSVYWFNDIASIEAENNQYSIYRPSSDAFNMIATADEETISSTVIRQPMGGTEYNRYVIQHIMSFVDVVDIGKELTVYDTFLALKGAVETSIEDVTQQRELNAYVSDTKAVLMLDAESPDNPPSTVPEPGENADPCSDDVDLKVEKIWKDWFNLGSTRPTELTINVYQQKFDTNGVVEDSKRLYETIKLTEANQESVWSAVWSTVLKDVPLYEYDDVNDNNIRDEGESITAYYVYTVEEVDVPTGYTVTYEPYDHSHAGDYTLTITNTLSVTLPDTGGIGSVLFTVVGVGILLPALTMRRRRSRGREN